MKRRGSGILLHVSSLPSACGIGDLGPEAYRMVDSLAEAGQSFWQILPLSPTRPVGGNSPYYSQSAYAGNPYLISPELLAQEGLLEGGEISPPPESSGSRVHFDSVIPYKERLFDLAFERFRGRKEKEDYEAFCAVQAPWLEDYSRFRALHDRFGGVVWSDWPAGLRDRSPEDLKALEPEISRGREREKFLQYLFFRQWSALKKHCRHRDIQIVGDIPIYVQYDSADVWSHPEIFKLDEEKKPLAVAGVPPDYFSKTGQRWGNPIYRWDVLGETGYAWWLRRLEHNLTLYDIVRIDHFLGLVAFWEIPAQDETAVNGKWVEASAEGFLKALFRKFPFYPMIAEDLGMVTPAVREVVRRFDIIGMKVLLFAFGDNLATNPYIPHNHEKSCILYTGTHDTNTVRGWFDEDASPEDRDRLCRYLGRGLEREEVASEFVRMAMRSVADVAILPMQDLLGLGAETRMNTPSTCEGNWAWRLLPGQFTPALIERLRELTEIYGRL